MCVKPQARDKVVPIRCQPSCYPCPTCGQRGHRKRRLDRFVRSLAYGQVVWLHVYYAEYTARCDCRKFFRSCPTQIIPKADYDNLVREAVLNRILDDGLNVQRTLTAMKRDFLLNLSSGFIYDCLNWGLARLRQGGPRGLARPQCSGVVCIDELHLGDYTLLLTTDPITDRIIGYSLVQINDQPHLRCFVRTLQYWGVDPKVVVTDGSNLYPKVLAEIWPQAKHQLCVFHVLQDVTNQVLAGVRRLRRQQARRGHGGRKRGRGNQGVARRRRRGPTNKEKAAFVYKHRFLIVQRTAKFQGKDWDNLCQLFDYLPELRTLWHFCGEVYQLFNAEQVVRLARRRRTLLLKKASYQEVPELVAALGLLKKDKFDKMVAFLECATGPRVRTNNHVERANRKLRFDEKVRYKWRSALSLERFLRLRLSRLDQQALEAQATAERDRESVPPEATNPGGD